MWTVLLPCGAAVAENVELLQTFRFQIVLTRSNAGPGNPHLGNGAFSECRGLELEADVKEYLEGGRNDGVVRRVGRVKLAPLVLKRGMFVATDGAEKGHADGALWGWLTGMVSGVLPVPRYNGEVEIHDSTWHRVVARWTFDQALPSKVTGPTLNAKTGEIAIEELHLVHQGLRLEVPQ
jgi:phage tail-like protein